jgi:two-component system, sensor histidine kinase ChiS
MARILVVDDVLDTREALAKFLRVLGHEVETAGLGLEALCMIRDRPHYDLLIVDYLMPGMDGRELIRQVRAQQGVGTPPAIAITGELEELPPGPPLIETKHVLHKPFSDGELIAAVNDVLSHQKGGTDDP